MGMSIYDIDSEILKCFDEETGELLDTNKLNELQLARDNKIENIACWIKNLKAEAEAIKAEEDILAKKRRSAENLADRLKNYLSMVLDGEKFKTAKVNISYRKSEQVHIEDESIFIKTMQEIGRDDLLIIKTPTPNKTAIKELLKEGEVIEGASIVTNTNIQIK